MIRITADLTELKALVTFFDGMAAKLNPEEILDEAEALLLNRIRTRFLAETGPDGQKWEESLAAKERRKKGGTGTLFDTGTLFHSIQAFAAGPNERAIGTDVFYAPYHNNGQGQVKREFMGFSSEDIDLYERLVLLRVQEALNG